MPLELLALLVFGALVSGFVNGLAGFGTGLVALGFWLHVIEPQQAGPLVVACSLIGGLPSLWRLRGHLDAGRLAVFVIPGLAAVPFGVAALTLIDPGPLKAALGAFLVAYAAFMLLRPHQVAITWGGRPADALVGLLGGFLGGIAGLSGALPTPWSALRGWPKHERRAIYQPFSMAILGLAFIILVAKGAIDTELWWLIAVCFPATLIGSWLGLACYGRIGEALFARLVLILLMISGLVLAAGWFLS